MTRKLIIGNPIATAALIGLALLVSGCGSQNYVSGISFYPQPAVVRVVHNSPDEQPPLTVQASIDGVRQADPSHNVFAAVVVKLNFDNSGNSHIVFDPGSLELENGSLIPFPPPQVQPPGLLDLAPGQHQDVTATFPLPPAIGAQANGLANLRLRWEVRIDNYPVQQTALFEKTYNGSGSAPGPTPDVAY